MWRMKNNDLEARIGIPDGFKVKGGDGRAISSWNEVKLSLIHISEPTRPY